MNAVIQAIITRRSIRKFKPDPISDADRDAIIQAGLYAPSAKNSQPWHITVVQNQAVMAEITRQTKAAIIRANVTHYLPLANSDTYSVNFGNAPLFMIVGADFNASACPVEDASLVLGNIMLAAHSLGIGSCWINQLGCVSDEPEFRQFLTNTLSFPTNARIVGSCALGYSAIDLPKPLPRKEQTINLIQ